MNHRTMLALILLLCASSARATDTTKRSLAQKFMALFEKKPSQGVATFINLTGRPLVLVLPRPTPGR